MLPSNSSALSCQVSQNIADINGILERITPIEFIPNPLTEQLMTTSLGTLTIQSDVQALDMEVNNFIASEVYTDTLTSPTITSSTISCNTTYIGNTTITSSGSTLQLPANTTIGGVPVSGAPIQYLYWLPVLNNVANQYIQSATSVNFSFSRQPYVLPVNGIFKSFSVTIQFSGSGGSYPITNFTVSLYANETNVGSATVATISGLGTVTLANNSLNYSATADTLVSLRYSFSSGTLPLQNSAKGSVGWISS